MKIEIRDERPPVSGDALAAAEPETVLLDQEAVTLAGVDAVRTLVADVGVSGVPTASEQWRTIAGGRRWTLTATTTLTDQPAWGPRLAAVVATFAPG